MINLAPINKYKQFYLQLASVALPGASFGEANINYQHESTKAKSSMHENRRSLCLKLLNYAPSKTDKKIIVVKANQMPEIMRNNNLFLLKEFRHFQHQIKPTD